MIQDLYRAIHKNQSYIIKNNKFIGRNSIVIQMLLEYNQQILTDKYMQILFQRQNDSEIKTLIRLKESSIYGLFSFLLKL